MPIHYADPNSNPTLDDARTGEYPLVKIGDIQAIDVRASFPDRRTATGDQYRQRGLETISHLIIHHGGSPYLGLNTVADLDLISSVYSYHVNEPTHLWPGIGYHFVLSPTTGNLYLTGGVDTIRYHATQANPYSIGLCVLGNWVGDTPYSEPLQDLLFKRLKIVADNIQKALGKRLTVQGHKEISQTACPGDWWGPEISNWFNTSAPGDTVGHPERDQSDAYNPETDIPVPDEAKLIEAPNMPPIMPNPQAPVEPPAGSSPVIQVSPEIATIIGLLNEAANRVIQLGMSQGPS